MYPFWKLLLATGQNLFTNLLEESIWIKCHRFPITYCCHTSGTKWIKILFYTFIIKVLLLTFNCVRRDLSSRSWRNLHAAFSPVFISCFIHCATQCFGALSFIGVSTSLRFGSSGFLSSITARAKFELEISESMAVIFIFIFLLATKIIFLPRILKLNSQYLQ